jgi:hypothetical protein
LVYYIPTVLSKMYEYARRVYIPIRTIVVVMDVGSTYLHWLAGVVTSKLAAVCWHVQVSVRVAEIEEYDCQAYFFNTTTAMLKSYLQF